MSAAIQHVLAERAGFCVEALGVQAFQRAVAARMSACAIAEPGAYADLLRGSQAELENLVEDLTVLETWFFRDRGPFEFLEQFARGRQQLRVLSAPCATGEEAYSIAMALVEAGWAPERFRVDACDISRRALRVAATAVYGRSSFREERRDPRPRWFRPGPEGFALRPEIAALVQFHREDLLHPKFLSAQEPYDLIFCRNLLIYLRPEAQRALIDRLGGWLRPAGVVVTGHAEVAALLRQGYVAVPYPGCFACRPAPAEPVRVRQRRVAAAVPLRHAAAPPPAPDRGRLLQWARQLADEGAMDDARALCEELLAREADAEAYYLEGLISAALDRLPEAEEAYRKALYLDPAHYECLVQMSLLCERRGEPARGSLFRSRAVRLAASRREVLDARRR